METLLVAAIFVFQGFFAFCLFLMFPLFLAQTLSGGKLKFFGREHGEPIWDKNREFV